MDRTRSRTARGARSLFTLSPWGTRQPWRPAPAVPRPHPTAAPTAGVPKHPRPTVLETSQAPVREAIRELQGIGLVTVKPYCGACVREVDQAEILEVAEVRAVLEGFAARKAGARLRHRAGDVRAALEGMRAAAGEGDVQAFGTHDLAFHRHIVEASEQATLVRAWESLGVGVRIRMLLERTGASLPRVAEAHDAIAGACARGDGEEAARLLERHPEAVYAQVGGGWPG